MENIETEINNLDNQLLETDWDIYEDLDSPLFFENEMELN